MRLPERLDVDLSHDEINFRWTPPLVAKVNFHWWSYPFDLARAIRASRVNEETYGDREYLERIFLVIAGLPVALGELPEVTSFRFINPTSGFVYDDPCTQIIEGDEAWIATHAARMASGEKIEYGLIEYNRSLRFNYNGAADMSGDITVGLPERHHGTYVERVRPLVERSLSGASFEYHVSAPDVS